MEEVKFPQSKQAKLLDPNLIRRRELNGRELFALPDTVRVLTSFVREEFNLLLKGKYLLLLLPYLVARLAGGAAQLDVGGPVG